MALRRGHIARCALVLLCAGIGLASYAAAIPVKAMVAQLLLERAWAASLADGNRHRPWPWADHWPMGRIRFPAHGVSQIILAGDGGHVLAFAPGWNNGSGALGSQTTSVVSAHRDTHFRVLAKVAVGHPIQLETRERRTDYRITDLRVVDARETELVIRPHEELVLVTCWPFDAVVPGGPLRLVATARPMQPPRVATSSP